MYSQDLFDRDQEPPPEVVQGVAVENSENALLVQAQRELDNLLPPPTPRRQLVAAKQATETAVKIVAQELVLAIKYRLTISNDPLGVGEIQRGREQDVLSLPRVRGALVELHTVAVAEAEALIRVEEGVVRAMNKPRTEDHSPEQPLGFELPSSLHDTKDESTPNTPR